MNEQKMAFTVKILSGQGIGVEMNNLKRCY